MKNARSFSQRMARTPQGAAVRSGADQRTGRGRASGAAKGKPRRVGQLCARLAGRYRLVVSVAPADPEWRLRHDVGGEGVAAVYLLQRVVGGSVFTDLETGWGGALRRFACVNLSGDDAVIAQAISALPDNPADALVSGGEVALTWPVSDAPADAPPMSALDVDAVLGGASVAHSVHSPEYQGVVAPLGALHRLIVNASFRSFVVQRRQVSEGAESWWPVNGWRARRLSRLVGKVDLAALRKLAPRLPDLPRDAAPEFVRFRSAQVRAFELTDWRRADYSRVVASVAEWRVVVDAVGARFLVQRAPDDCVAASGVAPWAKVREFDHLDQLRDWLLSSAACRVGAALSEALKTSLGEPQAHAEGFPLPLRPDASPWG